MDEADFWEKHGDKPSNICPRCRERPKNDASYCRPCRRAYHREWMRKNRPKHSELSEEERKKANCRSYTRVLVTRGELKKGPCESCGTTENVEAHHPDYSDPRTVVWKCRPCHRAGHA